MAELFDLNVTQTEDAKFSSNLGTAHEFFVTGILMRLGFDVSISSVKGGPYDLLITVYKNGPKSKQDTIKAQAKTCTNSIRFIGGIRGGMDRSYKSEVKQLVDKSYKYTEKDNDLIIGVQKFTLDLYLIPTRFLKHFGKSKSIAHLACLKNNWDILLNWRDKYLDDLFSKIGK